MVVSQMAPQHVRGPATPLSHRGKVLEKTEQVCSGRKKDSYHTECHVGVHINARMRPARELYAHQCRQLCADLKTNKKISVI